MIPILGMHRSGTSALASAIHKLGADLGPESSWLQPAADNPLGFYEYAPLVDLNRDILTALDGTWSSPPPLPPGWINDERLADLREPAAEISSQIPDRMVVKDPRLSLLQPLWDDVGVTWAPMLCLRHPVAVARSLQARNQFTIERGLFLWFRYNAAAILNRPDALIVEYETLLADPETQLNRVAKHMALNVSENAIHAAATTVYRSMAHHQGEVLPDTPVGEICRRLYDALQSDQDLAADHDVFIWARLATELPWAGAGDREISRVRREVTKLNQKIEQLTRANQEREQRLARLETELRHAVNTVDQVAISESADLLWSLGMDSP